MKLEFKNNFLGYFRFYYSVLGNRVLVNFALCVAVSFLDGMGLTMFMPLLQSVNDPTGGDSRKSLGVLHHVTDIIGNIGFTLNINTILVVLLVVFILKGLAKYTQLNYQTNLRFLFMKRMRYKLVDDINNLSYAGFLKMDAGKIQNTLISEVQRVFQTMNFYFAAAQAAVMLLTYITLAFLANYQFAIFVAVGAGVTNFLYRRIYNVTKKVSKDISKKGHDFNGLLIQAVHNFKYLKATNYFRPFSKKLKYVIDHTERLNQRMGSLNAITTSLKEPMIVVVVTVVIYIQINWFGASLTSILLSLLLFYRALSFLVLVQNQWQNFMHNIGAIDTVTEFSQDMEAMAEVQTGDEFTSLDKGITLKKIDFFYGDHKVIDNIDIHIPKNHTVAFVGESGSGKTTLANVIASLIDVQGGQVLLDGRPIGEYSLPTYRAKIGYISQEPVIFSDDIFNNITFWADRTEENINRFWEVINLAALTPYINSLPQKENTMLGDNGIMISGGQRQRISIARELYKDAQILILDEATSALDSETEKMIKENIDALHGSYTMIIIAHRLSTIKNADTIYLLDRGRVLDTGDFGNMVSNSARFRRMVELQEF